MSLVVYSKAYNIEGLEVELRLNDPFRSLSSSFKFRPYSFSHKVPRNQELVTAHSFHRTLCPHAKICMPAK